MNVANEHSYKIFGGDNYKLQWKCTNKIETYQWPYAMKSKSDKEESGAFYDGMKAFAANMFKESMDEVKFVLS